MARENGLAAPAGRVLAFDSWTRGAHHLQLLLPSLSARGLQLSLVHLGSWGSDPGREVSETIGDLAVRDITFYGTNSLERILDMERPDIVLFLSTQTLTHRALIRYCRHRGIATLLLYHAILGVVVTGGERALVRLSPTAFFWYVISRLGRVIGHVLPIYVTALAKTRADFSDWLRLPVLLAKMVLGRSTVVPNDDARTSMCAVYTAVDIAHATATYGFNPGQVIAVGNPDLIRFGVSQEMVGRSGRRSNLPSNSVMYIDAGLVAAGLFFPGLEAYCHHLRETAATLAAQGMGMRLKLKPHNKDTYDFLCRSLKDSQIEIVSNDNFVTKLDDCAACIVEPTTLAVVPAILGIPLLYAKYGYLTPIQYGPTLTTYPRGRELRDLRQFNRLLIDQLSRSDTGGLERWICENSGPLPADRMPDRVAEILESMITQVASAGQSTGIRTPPHLHREEAPKYGKPGLP